MVPVFSALGQPTRLRIMELLADQGADGLTSGQLARLAATPMNTMSGHLGVLANAGLVTSVRSGRSVTYGIVNGALAAAARHLTDLSEAGNARQLPSSAA